MHVILVFLEYSNLCFHEGLHPYISCSISTVYAFYYIAIFENPLNVLILEFYSLKPNRLWLVCAVANTIWLQIFVVEIFHIKPFILKN